MIARTLLAALLIFSGIACEKEIHEVRLHQAPQETLAQASARADSR